MLLRFDYKNWKGEDHRYVIQLDERRGHAISFDTSRHMEHDPGWYIHGYCVERDGKVREGLPRRSFRLTDMRNIEEVANPQEG